MNVVELPVAPLNDAPAMLRRWADLIEAEGRVCTVVLATYGDRGIQVRAAGVESDSASATVVPAAAHLRMVRLLEEKGR